MSYSYTERNLVNLKHLKKAAVRSQEEISTLAALVVGTIEDMILQEAITVPTASWGANSDSAALAEGYNYKADVSVTGLIENANVNITLSVTSLAVAHNACVCPTVIVSAGSVRFYSKTIPSSALSGVLDAIQLAVD